MVEQIPPAQAISRRKRSKARNRPVDFPGEVALRSP